MGSPIAVSGDEDNINFQTTGGVFDYPADTVDWNIREDGQSLVVLKQNAIRALFSEDHKELEIIPWNANAPMRCFPRVISIEFPQEGRWFKLCQYRITLEADQVFGVSPDESPTEDIFSRDSGNMDISGGSYDFVSQYNLEDATESYSISMDTEVFGIFKCSHNISAKGYRSLDSVGNVVKDAWDNARDWVNSRTGFNPIYIQSSTFGITGGFTAYNQFKTANTDIHNGSYSVTEEYILSSGNYYEVFSADVKQSITDPYKGVAVQGTIFGLTDFQVGIDEWTPSNGLIKYNNASGAWNGTVSGSLFTRAQTYIGIPINPLPVSQTVSHNFSKGEINYTWEFNNRPLTFVSGAISETISIIDDNPSGVVDLIASHIIINRAIGEILQPLNTTTAPTRTVSYEAVFPAPTYASGTTVAQLMALKPREQVNQLLSGLVPTNYYSDRLYVTQDNETWDIINQRYSRQYAWRYERLV